jgi:uncharacterized integral membrane protein
MRREPDEPRKDGSTVPGAGDGAQAGDRTHPAPEDQKYLKALQRARQARVAKVLVGLGILIVLIIFVLANANPVEVHFVFVTRHPKLIWVMIACAALGGILGYIVARPGRRIHLRDSSKRDKHEPEP